MVACSKDRSSQQAESPSNTAAADVAAEQAEQAEPSKKAAAAPSEVEGPAFKVAMRGSDQIYQVGEPANVQIVLNARGGFKCNDEYPYKFVPKESAGLTYLTKVVKKDAMTLGEDESVMTIPITPEAVGKQKVEGKFYFSVCNDETCLVEKKDLAFVVDVH